MPDGSEAGRGSCYIQGAGQPHPWGFPSSVQTLMAAGGMTFKGSTGLCMQVKETEGTTHHPDLHYAPRSASKSYFKGICSFQDSQWTRCDVFTCVN